MMKFLGAAVMPAFPTVDLSEPIKWFQDGITGIFTANTSVIIGLVVVTAGLTAGYSFIRKFVKSNVKG